MNLGETGL